MKRRLHRRWMAAMAAFTLAVTLLFGLLAMGFVYAVEDVFMERSLRQELQRQQAHRQAHGRWAEPVGDGPRVVQRLDELPRELVATLRTDPRRTEVPGEQGRHYHLLPLQPGGGPPWLLAEVSGQLIVRPMRLHLLGWLTGWGSLTLALALLLGAAMAHRVSRPLETLAKRVSAAEPQRPHGSDDPVARGLGDDEVGEVGRAFDALLARTRAFVEREQAFTRDASHELRTPLAVLRLQIERLQADAGTPAAVREALSAMHAATLLMQQTLQTLLLMAREADSAPATAPGPVPVLPLAEQWVLAHAEWLDHQPLSLHLALGRDDALPLPAPVLQLALASLLGNAFAHGTPGGEVQVALEDGALCVRNPGDEPPPDATEPYAKSGRSGGFGLGLAILQRLLQRHGARLVLAHADGVTRALVCAPGPWPPASPASTSRP